MVVRGEVVEIMLDDAREWKRAIVTGVHPGYTVVRMTASGNTFTVHNSKMRKLAVAKDIPAECEGHESLNGANMGESVYCDGKCVA